MKPSLSRVRPLLVTALVLLLGVAGRTQQLLRTHVGSAAGDGFGVTSPAGDVDGDGHPDLLVGAPHHATAVGADVGSVAVLSGGNGATLFTFTGDAAGDLFGWSCAAAGDVNDDGHGDVAVGAPGSGSAPGFVRVLSGATGAVLRTLVGDQAAGAFGFAVAGNRDLDGDGMADLVVGAPLQDHGGTDTGSAYAFSGATGAVLHVTHGAGPGDQLGYAVATSIGDVLMTDAEPGVIIGCTQGGGDGHGLVLEVEPSTFAVVHSFSGGAAGDALGASVAVVGDVDGDGIFDVAAGSDPHGAGGVPGGPGYARIWSGDDGALLHTITGAQAGTGFASSVAGVGDVNGDGLADLALGEPLADGNGADAGGVRVYSGADATLLHHVQGPAAGAHLGAAAACAGDLNADLLADFAVGAPGGGTSGAGSVFVLSLTRWEDLGSGLPGVGGIPRLTGQGGLVAQTQATLSLTAGRPITAATLVLGFALTIDATAGKLVPTPDLVTTGLLTNVLGELDYSFTWPQGVPSGFTCYYQFVLTDPAAPGGQSRSNAVAAIVP